jgi:hypothetical protein
MFESMCRVIPTTADIATDETYPEVAHSTTGATRLVVYFVVFR